MALIKSPQERREAWFRYEKRFGKPYPSSLIRKNRNNWEKEVDEINRCIREGKEAVAGEVDGEAKY